MVPLSEDEINQRLTSLTAPVIDAVIVTTLAICATSVAADRLAAAFHQLNAAMEVSELEDMFSAEDIVRVRP